MERFADTLRALAAIAWPILIGVLLYKLFPVIRGFLARDKVTIKFGEMEISAEQATQSLSAQVKDLQDKVIAIEKKTVGDFDNRLDVEEPLSPIRRGDRFRILWVDDVPANNAIQIEKLMSDGVWVDVASETEQAIEMFDHTKYDLVISDMGRLEGGVSRPDAGILLARKIRKQNNDITIVIFTTRSAILKNEKAALDANINLLTTSTVGLYHFVEKEVEKYKHAN